jgi:hypothetical protein
MTKTSAVDVVEREGCSFAVWLAWTLQADACEAMNREENML